jgi:hypothetical protein
MLEGERRPRWPRGCALAPPDDANPAPPIAVNPACAPRFRNPFPIRQALAPHGPFANQRRASPDRPGLRTSLLNPAGAGMQVLDTAANRGARACRCPAKILKPPRPSRARPAFAT